ncbi:MAG TPA: hypothetical protein VJ276_07560 [Thermoanaerobaculia bacterium]|nr:hypothetical protein [Thermoanaerobaculia bacterium]
MRPRWPAAVAFGIALLQSAGCASAGPRALRLAAAVQGSVATVVVMNEGTAPAAVSHTHYSAGRWLTLEIRTAEGERVGYPPETPETVIVTPARYVCLAPGESLTWRIDLRDFQLDFGGELHPKHLAFRLPPGEYRLRARYSDRSGRHGRCSSADIDLLSEWIAFAAGK